jgi:integrase
MTSADPKHRWLHNATLLISYSGTRLSEAANLTWADIEFANSEGEGFIHVRDESFLSESARSTKNGYSRKIPIHPSLAPVLKSLYEHNSTGRVVGGPRGGKLRSDKFGDSLREVALVPLAKTIRHERFQTITAHCFRHFFASICAASNLSQQTVMDWMGQRSDSMAKHYFHRNDEASLRNIKKIEPIFDVSTERTDDTLSTPDETEVAA